jgi:hypothetical protein
MVLTAAIQEIATAQTHAVLLEESQAAAAAPRVVSRWNDLPESIRKIFLDHGIHSMSDSGGSFAATDSGSVVDTAGDGHFVVRRPSRIRLLFAVQMDAVWLISYETGGIAHSYHVAEVILTSDSPIARHHLMRHRVSRETLASTIASHGYSTNDNWNQ